MSTFAASLATFKADPSNLDALKAALSAAMAEGDALTARIEGPCVRIGETVVYRSGERDAHIAHINAQAAADHIALKSERCSCSVCRKVRAIRG